MNKHHLSNHRYWAAALVLAAAVLLIASIFFWAAWIALGAQAAQINPWQVV